MSETHNFGNTAAFDPGRGRGVLPPGTLLSGKYEVLGKLGSGGMGVVYHVRHVSLKSEWAIKVLHDEIASLPGSDRRFEREAQVMHQLDHPGILRVDDFDPDPDAPPWLRMPLIQSPAAGSSSPTLAWLIAESGGVPEREAFRLLGLILDALAYAHGRGVIHRDLKPENILLDGDQPLIADFGLVGVVGAEWLASRVEQSQLQGVGTLLYMDPQQQLGQPADERSDLYAIGLIAFQLLTGLQRPGLKPVSKIRPSLAEWWDDWLATALDEQREQRFQSARAMRDDLLARASAAGDATLLARPEVPVPATVDRAKPDVAGVVSAAELKGILNARERLRGKWPDIDALPAEPGLADLLTRARGHHSSMEAAYQAGRFGEVSLAAKALEPVLKQIAAVRKAREAAEQQIGRAEQLLATAATLGAERHARTKFGSAQDYLSQAQQAHAAAQFGLAQAHGKAAVAELSQAISSSEPLRREELAAFVLAVTELIRTCEDPESGDARRAAGELADGSFLSVEQAGPLVNHAWELLADASLATVPPELFDTTLGIEQSQKLKSCSSAWLGKLEAAAGQRLTVGIKPLRWIAAHRFKTALIGYCLLTVGGLGYLFFYTLVEDGIKSMMAALFWTVTIYLASVGLPLGLPAFRFARGKRIGIVSKIFALLLGAGFAYILIGLLASAILECTRLVISDSGMTFILLLILLPVVVWLVSIWRSMRYWEAGAACEYLSGSLVKFATLCVILLVAISPYTHGWFSGLQYIPAITILFVLLGPALLYGWAEESGVPRAHGAGRAEGSRLWLQPWPWLIPATLAYPILWMIYFDSWDAESNTLISAALLLSVAIAWLIRLRRRSAVALAGR